MLGIFITIQLLTIMLFFPGQTAAQDYNLVETGQFGVLNDLQAADYVSFAIYALLGVAGVLAFIFLLLGGIQWITAGGDKDAVEKGRRKIIQAIVGLAITFSVYTIVAVINVLFSVDITQFDIPQL